MGCGVSTGNEVPTVATKSNDAQRPAAPSPSQALYEATAATDLANGSPAISNQPAGLLTNKQPSLEVQTTHEDVEQLADEKPETPITVRVGTKKKADGAPGDGIETIWDEAGSPRDSSSLTEKQKTAMRAASEARSSGAEAAAIAAAADAAEEAAAEEQERQSTMKSYNSMRERESERPPQPSPPLLENDPLVSGANGAGWGFGSNDEGLGLDPLAKVELNMNVLNEIEPCPGPGPGGAKNRYDTLTLSEEDSDDESSARSFDLQRWKRFYHWNKKKHTDLLNFLWKSFEPKKFSIYIIAYREQDKFFAHYQGDNLFTGFICRMQAAGAKCFGVMHNLHHHDKDCYKVLGMFIFEGQNIPQAIQGLPDFEHYAFTKANIGIPEVKSFIGALVTSTSPIPELDMVASREILL